LHQRGQDDPAMKEESRGISMFPVDTINPKSGPRSVADFARPRGECPKGANKPLGGER